MYYGVELIGYGQYSSPAVDENGIVYIGCTNYSSSIKRVSSLCAIYPNGTLKWEKQMMEAPITTPSIGHNGTIYVIQFTNLYAFDPGGNEFFNYSYDTLWSLTATPIIGPDGTVYLGGSYHSPYGSICAVDENGKFKWQYTTDWAINTAGTVSREGILVFSDKENLYALSSGGALIWKISMSSSRYNTPVLLSDGEISFKSFIIGNTPPTPPRIKSVYSGDCFINISWEPPLDDGGDPVYEYQIFRGTSSGDTSFLTSVDDDTLFMNDTDVEIGIRYYYCLAAVNNEGRSESTSEISAMPLARPDPPMNVSINITKDYILISWDPPEDDGGASLSAYDLYRGTDIDSIEYFKRIDVIKNSYQDREIKIGETYYYYITATNIVGESMPSDIVSATYRTAPTSPMNLTCVSGNGFIHVSWLEPANDGGSPVIRYQVRRGSVIVQNEVVAEPNADVLEYNDTSVTNGITYTYNVTTVSDVGISPPSDQISATPMTFPQPPLNLTVEPGNGYVNISWEPPLDNGGSHILYYYLYRSGSGVKDMEIEIPAGADLKYRDMDVVNGELYNYSISAANLVGVSDIIGPLQAMPKGISTPPAKISVLYGSCFVHIFWEPPLSDAGSSIIGYVVYRDNVNISETGSNVLEFNDTDVVNGITYSYYVTALNGIGESVKSESVWGYPFELPVETDPPTPPRDLTLEEGEDTITLSWSVPEDDGGIEITGYSIYRSLREDGQFEAVDTVSSSELSWTDDTIVFGRDYFYYVTAFNDVHESGPSNKVSGNLEGHVGDDDDDNGKEVNWLLIVIPAVLIILLLLGIGMFLIYRRGRKDENEDEMSSKDTEYEPPPYDFDTIQNEPLMAAQDIGETDWE